MFFNFGESNYLDTGHGNVDVNCKMGDTILGTAIKEKYESFSAVWYCSFKE